MLTELLILALFVCLPLTVVLLILFVRDVVNFMRKKIRRQRGTVIQLKHAPPKPDDPPAHFALVQHRFQDMTLETVVILPRRRWKKLTIGHKLRFSMGAEFPYEVFPNYWRRGAKYLLLWLVLLAASGGATFGILWLLEQNSPGSFATLF
ncbi:MAG: hypothetical protein ACOCZ8_03395 [Bacteroidota bacterium]